MTELIAFPYQVSAVEKILKEKSVLLVHPTGSGKTVTALLLVKRLLFLGHRRILIVGPANTLDNYQSIANKFFAGLEIKVIKKNWIQDLTISIVSYNFLRKNIDSIKCCFDLVVLDEIHHCKNPKTANYEAACKIRNRTKFFVGMTGTPYQNSFEEFSCIVNLTAGSKSFLEIDQFLNYRWNLKEAFFLKRWWELYFVGKPLRGPVIGLKNETLLKQKLENLIDVIDEQTVISVTNRPNAELEFIRVPITMEELKLCKKRIRKRNNTTFDRLDSEQFNDEDIPQFFNSMTHARQALLIPNYLDKSEKKLPSSKLRFLANEILAIKKKTLVFCNFVNNGVVEIARQLKLLGINARTYTGSLSQKSRSKLLKDFEENLLDVLCLSPVGGEGLNIPKTDFIIIADLHFNPEYVRQLIGRALRADGKKKTVSVKVLLAKSPTGEKTVDDRILEIFTKKEKIINSLKAILEKRTG